jgi:drug/metabolite transporter (DMT)-like permease
MGLIEPLIAVLLGALFLGETLTVRTTLGGLCILLAVAVVLDLVSAPKGRLARRPNHVTS